MIILAGTPLGNVHDASDRLRRLLATADVVAAEDTRRLRRLAADLDVLIRGEVVSFFEANETERAQRLLERAASGQLVVVVTDAGMPLISDPGYRLVAAAAERDIPVSTAPGPSAVTAALAVSGLPTDRFTFEGFPPRKPGQRQRALAALAAEPRTMVFFESPRRTHQTLADMAEAFGPERRAALCRELTKTHEQILRGTLAELAAATAATEVLGEVTLVVAGVPPREGGATRAELAHAHALRVADGEDSKAALKAVAAQFGVAKREVYAAVLDARGSRSPKVPRATE